MIKCVVIIGSFKRKRFFVCFIFKDRSDWRCSLLHRDLCGVRSKAQQCKSMDMVKVIECTIIFIKTTKDDQGVTYECEYLPLYEHTSMWGQFAYS